MVDKPGLCDLERAERKHKRGLGQELPEYCGCPEGPMGDPTSLKCSSTVKGVEPCGSYIRPTNDSQREEDHSHTKGHLKPSIAILTLLSSVCCPVVPGEPPGSVSATPHTTSSVLIQWQVRARGTQLFLKHALASGSTKTTVESTHKPHICHYVTAYLS